MNSTNLRRSSGWNADMAVANNIVINLLQSANAHSFFSVQWYELSGWMRDVMTGTQMMSRLAQCSRSWHHGLQRRLYDLQNTCLTLRLSHAELPEGIKWPACWRTLAADVRNV